MKRLTLLCGLACALALPAAAQDKLKIGYVTTLSGPGAAIGTHMRNGVELALDHLGRKMAGREVDIIYEDDQLRPELGKQKTDKLVQQDKVPFLAGYIWSNVILSSYKEAADAGVFFLSSVGGPSQIAGAECHQNFFAVSHENDQAPEAMGTNMNERGIKRLFLMAPNYAAGRDILGGAKRTYKGTIAGEEYTKWPGQLDFSAELARARSTNSDGMFVFYPGAAGAQFLAQYDQAGLRGKVPLFQVFTVDAVSLIQQKDLAMGVVGIQHWVNDLANDVNKRMVAEFLKRHNDYPSIYGAMAYDTIMLIASAVEAVNGNVSNKDAVRAALRAAKFNSLRGSFKFGNNHFPIHDFHEQETIKDAQGRHTLRTVKTVVRGLSDSASAKCPMKW